MAMLSSLCRECRVSKSFDAKHVQALSWLDSFVEDDKFAAGNSSMTLADISLLATYSTLKAAGVGRHFVFLFIDLRCYTRNILNFS